MSGGQCARAGQRVVSVCVSVGGLGVWSSQPTAATRCVHPLPPPPDVGPKRPQIDRSTWRRAVPLHDVAGVAHLRRSLVYLQLLNLSYRRSYFLTHVHTTNLL